jgi:hypothetical protein
MPLRNSCRKRKADQNRNFSYTIKILFSSTLSVEDVKEKEEKDGFAGLWRAGAATGHFCARN